jgi:hypothetical protein
MIAEAQTAYHELFTGQKATVVIDSDGSRVEFAKVDTQKLYLYIQSLQSQLDLLIGGTRVTPANGPMGFLF